MKACDCAGELAVDSWKQLQMYFMGGETPVGSMASVKLNHAVEVNISGLENSVRDEQTRWSKKCSSEAGAGLQLFACVFFATGVFAYMSFSSSCGVWSDVACTMMSPTGAWLGWFFIDLLY